MPVKDRPTKGTIEDLGKATEKWVEESVQAIFQEEAALQGISVPRALRSGGDRDKDCKLQAVFLFEAKCSPKKKGAQKDTELEYLKLKLGEPSESSRWRRECKGGRDIKSLMHKVKLPQTNVNVISLAPSSSSFAPSQGRLEGQAQALARRLGGLREGQEDQVDDGGRDGRDDAYQAQDVRWQLRIAAEIDTLWASSMDCAPFPFWCFRLSSWESLNLVQLLRGGSSDVHCVDLHLRHRPLTPSQFQEPRTRFASRVRVAFWKSERLHSRPPPAPGCRCAVQR